MVQVLRRSLPHLVLILVVMLLAGAAAAEGFEEIEPPDLETVLAADPAPLLLDVRTPEEFSGGHIPGALLIPIDELPNRLDELAAFKERGVVAYCEHGRRATRALELLESAGFRNLRLLAGNMSGWRGDDRVEKP